MPGNSRSKRLIKGYSCRQNVKQKEKNMEENHLTPSRPFAPSAWIAAVAALTKSSYVPSNGAPSGHTDLVKIQACSGNAPLHSLKPLKMAVCRFNPWTKWAFCKNKALGGINTLPQQITNTGGDRQGLLPVIFHLWNISTQLRRFLFQP